MLETLVLDNFKSYKGHHTIGPFRQFTAIIGPNGSGKSNLMDAICFVLGEKASNLRVRKLTDLIHGAPVGKPVATKCSVTMNFLHKDGRRSSYTRQVSSGGSEYRVDNKVVNPSQYTAAIEELELFIKAKNFLVYQGAIEAVAMKNPKERTALFEEISRSCEFQAEYDRLKTEMQRAEEDAQSNLNKRRGIAQEKREAKLEKEEAEKFQQMKKDVAEKQTRLYLLELFHCERSANQAKEELDEKRGEVTQREQAKLQADEAVQARQKIQKKLVREQHKLDKDVADKNKEVTEQRPRHVQAKHEVIHVTQKAESAQKAAAALQKMADQNSGQVDELKKKSKQLEKQKAEAEAELSTQRESMDMQLSESQVKEYYALKADAGARSARIDSQITQLQQEQKTDRNSLLHEKSRLQTWSEKIKTKELEIERQKRQIETLKETEENQINLLEDEKRNFVQLEKQVRSSKERLETVSTELADVTRQLQDAQGDTMESEREKRRNEAIDNLKRVFPDKVFGRLVDLCTPSHRRFQIAITKILATNMMSIVCDNEETARECIVYLKEQRYPPETFLPTQSLDVHPINEKLRELKEPAGVKLVFDVLQCNAHAQAARKALQYACGNALICETAEDARYLAFGGAHDRYKAVALDGTLFQQSGVISGGGRELKGKAKKWDDKLMKSLKEKKSVLMEETQSLHRTRRKELDVEMKRNQISGLENKIQMIRRDRNRVANETIQRLNNEFEALNSELSVIPPKIEEIEERMRERQVKIERLEQQTNAVADQVFAEFCRRIGIDDIRQYEQREMRFHEEAQEKLKEFDNELDRIRNEIEYLKSEDKAARAKAEADKVKKLHKDLTSLKKKEEQEGKALAALEAELEKLKMKAMEKKAEVEEGESEVSGLKKEALAVGKEVTAAEKAVLALEQAVARKLSDRHALLHAAKINLIALPLISGSLADIDAEDEDDDPTQPSASALSQEQIDREAKIRVNYKTLPENLKELDDDDEVKKKVDTMTKEISEQQAHLSKLNAPNLRANQRMEQVREKEQETTEECEAARKKARKVRQAFEKIKTERYRRFQECFEPVAAKIDDIYKALSRNDSAQAFLGADNMEEPYLEGIQYNCVAPGKRFRPMDNLSGGEKTVAALALLFAVHSRNPSPFFVLDEIDAALDNTNIGKVAAYIVDKSRDDFQVIVISLKEEFYNKADALVGIFPQPANCTVSGVLTLDLTKYKQAGQNDTTMEG